MKPATLSGARETFTFDEAVPRKMEELHLRFDFLSPGLYRIFDAGFEAVDAPVPAPVSARKPTARKPELIFYAPFDGNGEAVTAGGRKSPLEERNTVYTEGIRGGALRTSKAAGSMLRYAVSGNLLPDAGTISLWFKPEWKAFAGTSSERSGWRTLLTMDRPASRLGSGAVWFWCWGNLLRGDHLLVELGRFAPDVHQDQNMFEPLRRGEISRHERVPPAPLLIGELYGKAVSRQIDEHELAVVDGKIVQKPGLTRRGRGLGKPLSSRQIIDERGLTHIGSARDGYLAHAEIFQRLRTSDGSDELRGFDLHHALLYSTAGAVPFSMHSFVMRTREMLREGASYMRSVITFSTMDLSPLAPVCSFIALSATA